MVDNGCDDRSNDVDQGSPTLLHKDLAPFFKNYIQFSFSLRK